MTSRNRRREARGAATVAATCRAAVVVAVLLGPRGASAVELYTGAGGSVELGGDIKSFFIGVSPYEHALMPDDPYGQGILDTRLELSARAGRWLVVAVHEEVTAVAGTAAALGPSAAGGHVEGQPQVVDLSWDAVTADGMRVSTRVDRAFVTLRLPAVDLTLGRQPISFGSTFFFNPMDLVAPFSPVVIDREYKPGVDAARADAFFGTSGKLTLVAAYAGGFAIEQTVLAGHAGTTLGLTDVGVFYGLVRGDRVAGVDAAGELLGVALRGEATLTWPPGGEPFVRAALGADHRIDCGLSLMGELYVQTLGANAPEGYAELLASERYARGEIWAVGRYYAAASATYELLPILELGLFAVANLADPSALVGPSLTWSVADEAELVAGAYFGLGERPAPPDPAAVAALGGTSAAAAEVLLRPRSELGLFPAAGYVELKLYF